MIRQKPTFYLRDNHGKNSALNEPLNTEHGLSIPNGSNNNSLKVSSAASTSIGVPLGVNSLHTASDIKSNGMMGEWT